MDVVTVDVKVNGVDEAVEKATELTTKIQEAKTLAGELASMMENLKVDI